MPFNSRLLIIAFCILSTISFADRCKRSFGALWRLRFEVSVLNSTLKPETRKKIADLFSAPFESDRKLFQELKDLYLKDRLEKLPAYQKAKVEQFVKNAVYKIEGNSFFRVEEANTGIEIAIPEKLRNTISDLELLAHETEHAIQLVYLEEMTGSSEARKLFSLSADREFWFVAEIGAMLAEREVLSAIPQEYRHEFAKSLDLMDGLPEDNKKHRQRHLRSAHLDPQAYLENEWKHGRYSEKQIRDVFILDKNAKPDPYGIPKLLSLLAGFLGAPGIGIYCNHIANRPGLPVNETFFNSVCRPIVADHVLKKYDRLR